jgi:hypothetical protein
LSKEKRARIIIEDCDRGFFVPSSCQKV